MECEQPGSLGKALRDETKTVARETNYSLSQNCWDTFVSSRPNNVNVNDLDTEGKKRHLH